MQNGTATLEDSLADSHKLNIVLTYNLATALLSNYPNELKTYVTQILHTNVYYSITFGKIWKQPKCPSKGEWIHTLYGTSIQRNIFQQ